jgi:hypothetical protein
MTGMSDVVITREDGPEQGRYVARVEGIDAAGELIFAKINPQLIRADHTEVPEALRGRGLGLKLVSRMVEEARAGGVKILARCPYVKAGRAKHPEWADVFQE